MSDHFGAERQAQQRFFSRGSPVQDQQSTQTVPFSAQQSKGQHTQAIVIESGYGIRHKACTQLHASPSAKPQCIMIIKFWKFRPPDRWWRHSRRRSVCTVFLKKSYACAVWNKMACCPAWGPFLLWPEEVAWSSSFPAKMQIFVHSQGLHAVDVNETSTVRDIKSRVEELEGLAVEEQVLCYAGCPLEDDVSLSSCNLADFSTLTVSSRLLGGSVTMICI